MKAEIAKYLSIKFSLLFAVIRHFPDVLLISRRARTFKGGMTPTEALDIRKPQSGLDTAHNPSGDISPAQAPVPMKRGDSQGDLRRW
jgi:hypothetical protein